MARSRSPTPCASPVTSMRAANRASPARATPATRVAPRPRAPTRTSRAPPEQAFGRGGPNFPRPTLLGSSQGLPTNVVTLVAGIYSGFPSLNSNDCWFLSGGVYDFQAGLADRAELVSNELKPPDEPRVSNTTVRAASQFWDTNGVNCSGAFQVTITNGSPEIQAGTWSFVITSI